MGAPCPFEDQNLYVPRRCPQPTQTSEIEWVIHLKPSIRNYKIWLDWWACQLHTPHWWAELTTIHKVEDTRRLAWKIWASFLILAVRCEAFPVQDNTIPPASKCLTRGRLLPSDPSYQDV